MRFLPCIALSCLVLPWLKAEEGMWTFDNLPRKALKEHHGFEPTQAWLDHLRLASLRFPGGSGAFVSAEGLVLTNHHVVRGYLQRLSTPERNLLEDGFVARTRSEELRIPGLELMQLVEMENISTRVDRAVAGIRSEAEAVRARDREIQRARQEKAEATGLTVEPVILYQGGETWLYAYKTYTDVRLVLAPELAVARFGGDHDNFTYPRHHLDFALLRVYEQDRPLHPTHHLRWSTQGLKSGELSFISGHPGSTQRLLTLAQMTLARDVLLPLQIASRERRRALLESYAQRGFAERSHVGGVIYSLDNGLKALRGYLAGLKDPEVMARVARAEADLRARIQASPKLRVLTGSSWDRIEQATRMARSKAREEQLILSSWGSEGLETALQLVRWATEVRKPDAQRLPEYTEAALPELQKRLTRPRTSPVRMDLEFLLLKAGLEDLQRLGPQHPSVQAVLGGRSPEAVARQALDGTKLLDPSEVERLLKAGPEAVAKSADPLLALARRLDPERRRLRAFLERHVEGPIREHATRIARARFDVLGRTVYPDATFTLRLTYGAPAAYPANGTLQPPFTTLHGLFDRFEGWGGTTFNLDRNTWRLPRRWLEAKPRLDLTTPYNFASTHDIIGGNSGSPVVNIQGELVGLAFDGNLESLAGRYVYDGRANRTVNLDARAILEVLRKVYEAEPLVHELTRP